MTRQRPPTRTAEDCPPRVPPPDRRTRRIPAVAPHEVEVLAVLAAWSAVRRAPRAPGDVDG